MGLILGFYGLPTNHPVSVCKLTTFPNQPYIDLSPGRSLPGCPPVLPGLGFRALGRNPNKEEHTGSRDKDQASTGKPVTRMHELRTAIRHSPMASFLAERLKNRPWQLPANSPQTLHLTPHTPKPQTPNLNPHPKPLILNPKPHTLNPKSYPEPGAPSSTVN